MVREPYDCIIGDARIRAIPLGRVATVRGSLWRHAYTATVETMMNRRKGNAEPEGPSQLNPNAAGIDVGATSHFAAVPSDRVEEPVREFAAFTADLYRLADWLAGGVRSGDRGHGVDRGVLDTAVRGVGRAGV